MKHLWFFFQVHPWKLTTCPLKKDCLSRKCMDFPTIDFRGQLTDLMSLERSTASLGGSMPNVPAALAVACVAVWRPCPFRRCAKSLWRPKKQKPHHVIPVEFLSGGLGKDYIPIWLLFRWRIWKSLLGLILLMVQKSGDFQLRIAVSEVCTKLIGWKTGTISRIGNDLGVSLNGGFSPQIFHFNGGFPL